MTREVLARKLAALERFLDDLRRHRGTTAKRLREDLYRVERLLELVVQVAVDVVTHELADRSDAARESEAAPGGNEGT